MWEYLTTEIMTANKLCLEEYIDFVKDYTFEKPLTFTAFDDTEYSVYYVAVRQGQHHERACTT